MEHENGDYTNCSWCSWYGDRRIGTRSGGLGNCGMSWYCPNYIGQNTEKSPGDLRRLAVTETPVKSHQRLLMWKTLGEWNNNNKNTIKNHDFKLHVADSLINLYSKHQTQLTLKSDHNSLYIYIYIYGWVGVLMKLLFSVFLVMEN